MSHVSRTEVTTAARTHEPLGTFKATQLIWLALGVLETLIALRVLLKLIAANPANPFAALLYAFTDLVLLPFAGLTRTPAAGGMVFEVSSLIAMVVYALAFWALERLVWVVFYRDRETHVVREATTVDRDRL
jgi:hypothetical protein